MLFTNTKVQASELKNDAKVWCQATGRLFIGTGKIFPALGRDIKANHQLRKEIKDLVLERQRARTGVTLDEDFEECDEPIELEEECDNPDDYVEECELCEEC